MDRAQRIFYRQAFTVRFLRSTGTEFQNLFADLMQRAHKGDFHKVRPYGKNGDLKCDGYLPSKKTVFQCYAPRELKEAETVTKVSTDYVGAKRHWGPRMMEWIFVHNDEEGLPPLVVQTLADLKVSEVPIIVGTWTHPELSERVEQLNLSDLEDMFGAQPTESELQRVSFPDLQGVLVGIAKSEPEPEPEIKAPSLRKIEFNRLSMDSANFLALGRHRERAVQDFLERWPDPSFADQIAQTFRSRYTALKANGLTADEILCALLSFAGFDSGGSTTHKAAILAVISYFFERCEIFEDPDGKVFGQ